MFEIITQIWITIFGCSAIWLVGRLESWKRWGYIFGLLSQPAWLYTSIKHEQWGIVVLSLWYTYSWCQGIYNYWILPLRNKGNIITTNNNKKHTKGECIKTLTMFGYKFEVYEEVVIFYDNEDQNKIIEMKRHTFEHCIDYYNSKP